MVWPRFQWALPTSAFVRFTITPARAFMHPLIARSDHHPRGLYTVKRQRIKTSEDRHVTACSEHCPALSSPSPSANVPQPQPLFSFTIGTGNSLHKNKPIQSCSGMRSLPCISCGVWALLMLLVSL
jgi:hypothetical protein